MPDFLNKQLSQVLLDIEGDLSSTGLADLSIDTLMQAIKQIKFTDTTSFFEQFDSLYSLVIETKPRIGIIIYYFTQINSLLLKRKENITNSESLYKIIDEISSSIKKEFSEDMAGIIKNGVNLVENGDTILIHTPSGTIKNILKEAKKVGKKFKIILSEQSDHKTDNIIIFLQENNIDFTVVPEFMLSNVEVQINKMFDGALTLNSNYNFIVSTGLNSIVSEFHFAEKKTYVFLSTKKFSLWKSDLKGHSEVVLKEKQIESLNDKIKPYSKMKFSHDRISVDLFDYIVTEDAIMTPSETKQLYDKLYKQRETLDNVM